MVAIGFHSYCWVFMPQVKCKIVNNFHISTTMIQGHELLVLIVSMSLIPPKRNLSINLELSFYSHNGFGSCSFGPILKNLHFLNSNMLGLVKI